MEFKISRLSNNPISDLEEVLGIKGQFGTQGTKQPRSKHPCEDPANAPLSRGIYFLLKGEEVVGKRWRIG
jgi:hypothetical protein|nr:hypothetical protein Q903MT_gene1940 [Picea sitchensis]